MRAAARRWPTRRPAAVERIAAPVLLVTGDEDGVAPPQAVRALAERCTARSPARVVVLPRCGHWTPIERPEECQRELRDVSRRHSAERGVDMADVLFTNVRIFDGGGEAPFTGDVLVQGNTHQPRRQDRLRPAHAAGAGAQVIDGAGAFLMPGMVEAHTHFSLERPAEPRRHPAHAARGAHPVVRRGRQALPRHGLDRRASAPPPPSRGWTW